MVSGPPFSIFPMNVHEHNDLWNTCTYEMTCAIQSDIENLLILYGFYPHRGASEIEKNRTMVNERQKNRIIWNNTNCQFLTNIYGKLKIFDFQNKEIIIKNSNDQMDFFYYEFPWQNKPDATQSQYSSGNIENLWVMLYSYFDVFKVFFMRPVPL